MNKTSTEGTTTWPQVVAALNDAFSEMSIALREPDDEVAKRLEDLLGVLDTAACFATALRHLASSAGLQLRSKVSSDNSRG